MRLLFLHQNLPGQFRHLIQHYSSQSGVSMVGMGEAARLQQNCARPIPNMQLCPYAAPKALAPNQGHRYLQPLEMQVRRAELVATELGKLRQRGFVPDVMLAHPGWGESLFAKDVFPEARLLNFCEFYYNVQGQDVGFDPEYPPSAEVAFRMRLQNTAQLQALAVSSAGLCPTQWQRSTYPAAFRPIIETVHDGIDTDVVKPNPDAFITLPALNLRLTRSDEIITFVNRNLEPYRGFHIFMRALPELLRRRPNAQVIIVGGDDVSYGRRPAGGQTYRQLLMKEVGKDLDLKRVHFVGYVPYGQFVNLMQVSTAHVYLTYPFVLGWSVLEAMAAGALVIGSRTAPVEEVIRHGENGLLVDFFSIAQLVDAVCEACDNPERMNALRQAARRMVVERFDLKRVCLPRQLALVERLAAGKA